ELPCGSMSTNRVFFSMAAMQEARLTVVVVFPTPPFWLVMQIIRAIVILQKNCLNRRNTGERQKSKFPVYSLKPNCGPVVNKVYFFLTLPSSTVRSFYGYPSCSARPSGSSGPGTGLFGIP